MKNFNVVATLLSAIALTLTGCGGSDDNSDAVEAVEKPTAGYYQGHTVMKGYDVTSSFVIDPQGNFLGLSYNDPNNSEPSVILTVVKGNVDDTKLYEFDIISEDINRYDAVTRRQVDNSVLFSFSNIPSSLERPATLSASPIFIPDYDLTRLIGTRNSDVFDLEGAFTGVLEIRATTNPLVLDFVNTETSNGCTLTGKITRQAYQQGFSDIKGTFSGTNCYSAGKEVNGFVEYAASNDSVVMYGTTNDNTNGFVILPAS